VGDARAGVACARRPEAAGTSSVRTESDGKSIGFIAGRPRLSCRKLDDRVVIAVRED
jgi:hypothetical protein